MTNGSLDAHIGTFIASCINSVEQLEILILLRQKTSLDVATINRELRTSEASVHKRLDDLIRKNLVSIREVEGRAIYAFDPPERLLPIIDELNILYGTHRVAVISEIFSSRPICY